MLPRAEFDRMLVEDRRQRAQRDDRVLTELGILRKFNAAQPRDPGGEGGGRWIKSPTTYTIDAFERLYTGIVDEAAAGDLVVSVHENGDFVLSAHEDGRRAVLFDGLTPDIARSVADDVDWAATAHISDDADNDPGTHLVDWRYAEEDIIVGFDLSGDVSIRFPKGDGADPKNLDDFDVHDMSSGDAADLVDALREMADRQDELTGPGTSNSPESAFGG